MASTERVDDIAARTVDIHAALTYLDQVRHTLDGKHDACQACGAPTISQPRRERGIAYIAMVADHDGDCPVRLVEAATARLNEIAKQM